MISIRKPSIVWADVCMLAICIVLLTLLVATISGIRGHMSQIEADRIAESDYRRIKSAVFNAIADREVVKRFIFWGHAGPFAFGEPLRGVLLNRSVHADVFHRTKRRINQRPISVTRIEVFHENGSRRFVFTETNGKIAEQQVEL